MRKLLLKNSVSGIIQFILTAILTLIAVPVFINKLGTKGYGIFSILSVIGSISTFSHLGLNVSLVKFLAEQGKCRESGYDILVTLILLLAITIPISLLIIVFNKFIIINLLNIPIESYVESRDLFILLVISNFLMLIGQVFTSIINASQRMYISNNLKLVYSFIYWSTLITIISLGFGLKEIGYGSLFASGLLFILTIIFALKIAGNISVFGLSANFKRIAIKQMSYGFKMYSASIISFFYEPLTKILISRFIGLSEVGFYDIALKVKNYLVSILSKPFEPLFPYLAQLSDEGKIRTLVHDLEQKSLLLILPLVIIFFFSSDYVVTLWLSNSSPHLLAGVKYISIFYLYGLITTPNYQFLAAKGHAGITILLHLCNTLVNIIIILFLFNNIGYYSVIIGNSIAILSSFILSLFYQNKFLNSLIFNNAKQLIYYILIGFTLSIVCYLMSLIRPPYISLCCMCFIVPIITWLLYRYFKFITINDITRYFGEKSKLSIILQKAF
jgi:O-antigen/teichoic acid export membrane protein